MVFVGFFWEGQQRLYEIVNLTSVLTCQVICGQIALKGLMLNMPPEGAVLLNMVSVA